ncbi:ABC transporter ATP-binding protein [Georgenia sunbinii]|uniref:ABC transporter ATP-binding protein n=1 Tax=Georgenia sunbinii TaxID=3117728 RepID=UPI002F2690B0
MTPTIEVRDLVKTFGATRALDGVDLTVEQGEVHGFLGPNGAGKSTTIRVLLGLLRADSGRATVLGGNPWRDAVELHRRLAYVPGDVSLWPNLTGGETIDLFARLRGGFDQRRRDELVERFDLDPTKKGRTYSKGNRQKVAIVAALASDVELLVLDEPTAGLDPLMETIFAEAIVEERDKGRTVLLSSHTLAQVEKLCEQISIIRQGVIVESGSLSAMRHLTRITVVTQTERPARLTDVPGVHDVVDDGDNQLRLDVDSEHLDGVVGALHAAGIRSLVSHPATLEQLFMRHYGEDLAQLEGTRSAS